MHGRLSPRQRRFGGSVAVSSVALLLGLLVVAYVGSQLLGGKGGGLRLASGAEYLLLGLALGPYALGVVSRITLQGFAPISLVGIAWVALVIGGDYGYDLERRVSARGLFSGIALASISFVATAGALYYVGARFHLLSGDDLWLVSCGVALVSSETTRHAVRWVLGRHAADGPLARFVGDVADCDDLVPILGKAVVFAAAVPHGALTKLPAWGLALAPFGIGAVLGVTAAALLRAELKASDGWGVLIGATLVATGVSFRLGLSTLAGTFALGLTLAAASRHRKELRAMLRGTEQAVILPLMLLAGALVSLEHRVLLVGCLLGAFAIRIALRLLLAPALTKLAGAPRSAAPSLALGLMPSGALSVIVGMAYDSRIGGRAGSVVLGVSVGLTLIGEIIGPASLRRALTAAGEIQVEADPSSGVPPTDVPSPEPSE